MPTTDCGRMTTVVRRALAVLALCVAAGGCSGTDEQVADVAARFYGALADSDGAAACRLLAPPTRAELESSSGEACDRAIVSEVTGSRDRPDVDAAGDAARARVGDDTAFLAEYAAGWRVVAAGCSPPTGEDRPYDCVVQGG
jgi:hypothetical protein